jgi:hypothetical protein
LQQSTREKEKNWTQREKVLSDNQAEFEENQRKPPDLKKNSNRLMSKPKKKQFKKFPAKLKSRQIWWRKNGKALSKDMN